ncbi:hypothetical protein I317_04278 [Kwoniella heveanensis CBS 569]|uniref:Uncharacterized protein n=1 Tax=Kwoniella heveanensis BCC8398 TaxID=1296120 RepID=A0A1B9GPS4_9TREE|nr:hypothetical protein I316_05344 [Kwoniella heveanensis BCC8398]OCF41868.1 hypothetical protein I317_04278 [Kwoniella heveanensis CBS 569]
MLFDFHAALALLGAMSFALAIPAAQPETRTEDFIKRAGDEMEKRQVITCGYYEVCCE